MTFPALCELLRELFVNVAENDFALPGKQQTDSRISLLTGVHRKEVRRLRGAGRPLADVPASLSRTSRILAQWLGSRAYCDAAGRPLPLPRLAAADEPSFERLVASVTRDVRPRAVLDEWLDRGIVMLQDNDKVVLLAAALVPHPGDEQLLYYFGRNIHDHLAAAAANVSGAMPPHLERAVHYDGLSSGTAALLESRSRTLALEALQTLNHEATVACEADGGGRWRWNFGVYVYSVEEPDPDPDPGAAAAAPDPGSLP